MLLRRKTPRSYSLGEVYAILPEPEEVYTYTIDSPVVLTEQYTAQRVSDCSGDFCNVCADGRRVKNPVDCGGAYTPAPQPMASGPGPGGTYTQGSGIIAQTSQPPAPVSSTVTRESAPSPQWTGVTENTVYTMQSNAPAAQPDSSDAAPSESGGLGLVGFLSILAVALDFL